jgi:hypothetical protein
MMVEQLNYRERQALERMDICIYRFELLGKFGRGVGEGTLDGLVARGLAEKGDSPRQPGQPGWAITDAGKQALRG